MTDQQQVFQYIGVVLWVLGAIAFFAAAYNLLRMATELLPMQLPRGLGIPIWPRDDQFRTPHGIRYRRRWLRFMSLFLLIAAAGCCCFYLAHK